MIEIENDTRNWRISAVLAGADVAHAIRIKCFLGITGNSGTRKIEQNPVGIFSSFNRWLDRRTKDYFHAHTISVPHDRNPLHGSGAT